MTNHAFFSKSIRQALVIPNRVVVHSYADDNDQYSGEATSAASYALLPKSEFIRAKLTSNAQATAIAEARIAQHELYSQRGSVSVPLNVAQEVHDYIRVIDDRASDYRDGNIGFIRRSYNPNANNWKMVCSFGKTSKKPILGTLPSTFEQVIPEEQLDMSRNVTWGDLTNWWIERLNWLYYGGKGQTEEVFGIYDIMNVLQIIFPNIEKVMNYLNKVEDSEDVPIQISNALVGYQRSIGLDIDTTLKAEDTVYQNTTGKVLVIMVSMNITDGQYLVKIGTTSPPTTQIANPYITMGSSEMTGCSIPITFLVPPGYYYAVYTQTGSPGIEDWTEWAIG